MEDGTPVIGRVLYGGRVSSKSHDAAGVAIARSNFSREVFLCTRMFQNRIADSVYTLLKDKIDYFGLTKEYKVYADAIEHKKNGSLFRFYGIARNITEIKSFEGATVWWNEESHNLTKEMFSTIRPTIMRNDGAEMWFTMNPQLASDYSYKRLIQNPPKGFLVRQINYPENPFILPSALADIEKEFEEDYEEAAHIYLGIPKSEDESALIKRIWIEAAVDAHSVIDVDMSGIRKSAVDLADQGKDENAQAFVDGLILRDVKKWKGKVTGDIYATVELAISNCAESGNYSFLYDADGLGAGARGDARKINESRTSNGLPIIEAQPFHGSGEIVDKDLFFVDPVGDAKGITNGQYFSNYKAQSWWSLRERFRKTYQAVVNKREFDPDELISIDPECSFLDELKEELSNPKRKSGSTKFTVDKAPDGVPSPNLADSVMMAYAPQGKPKQVIFEAL